MYLCDYLDLDMNEFPLLSVVICTYNQERYISETIESVLSQKIDFSIEIIVSDDCSLDSTPEICKEYQRKFPNIIRFYRNSSNKGLLQNYFDSLRLAKGKYIADLGGDDKWVDDKKLAKQVEIMESDAEIVLCHTGWERFTNDGQILDSGNCVLPKNHIVPGNSLTDTLLKHNKEEYFVHLCTSVYRRDAVMKLIENYPMLFCDPDLPCEDFQLISMLSTMGKFAGIEDKTLLYRVGHPSVSSTENPYKVSLFAYKVVRLTLLMIKVLKKDIMLVERYYTHDVQYALIHAFMAKNKTLRDEIKKFIDSNSKTFPATVKNKITLFLTGNKYIWNFALCLYKFLKKRN